MQDASSTSFTADGPDLRDREGLPTDSMSEQTAKEHTAANWARAQGGIGEEQQVPQDRTESESRSAGWSRRLKLTFRQEEQVGKETLRWQGQPGKTRSPETKANPSRNNQMSIFKVISVASMYTAE